MNGFFHTGLKKNHLNYVKQVNTLSRELPKFRQSFLHLSNEINPRLLKTSQDKHPKCTFAIAHLANPLLVNKSRVKKSNFFFQFISNFFRKIIFIFRLCSFNI
jgi:hypothetical protein